MTGMISAKHSLPPLPYDVSALEPHIDTRTMMLHYQKHHSSYVDSLNQVLKSAPELQEKNVIWLLANLSKIPDTIRAAVQFLAGGHFNHSMLWRTMSPGGGGIPRDQLADAINQAFNSFEKFKQQFELAGNQLRGPGWVWLIQERFGGSRLKIVTTSGHDNPVTQGYLPLLVSDLWEHAYYLKHENRLDEYQHGWWSVVHWEEVAARLAQSQAAFRSTSEMNDIFFPSEGAIVPASRQVSH